MTEQEYIDTHDIVAIRIVKSILRDLTPETSCVILLSELQDIMKVLSKWEDKLVTEIKTTNQ